MAEVKKLNKKPRAKKIDEGSDYDQNDSDDSEDELPEDAFGEVEQNDIVQGGLCKRKVERLAPLITTEVDWVEPVAPLSIQMTMKSPTEDGSGSTIQQCGSPFLYTILTSYIIGGTTLMAVVVYPISKQQLIGDQ